MTELMTIEEAAAKLRKSKRWLQYFLRAHPVDSAGKPLFKQLGRSKLFDETDIAFDACRHGFATALLRAGVDVATIAKLGRWEISRACVQDLRPC
jgi:hypothetical protein